MGNKKVKVQVSWSGDNFTAHSEVNGVVFATADTLEEVKKEFKSAFEFHVESSVEDAEPIPFYIAQGDYELNYELDASAMLKITDKLITRASLSRVTGIDQKQLGHYIQGKSKSRKDTSEKIRLGIIKITEELQSVVR